MLWERTLFVFACLSFACLSFACLLGLAAAEPALDPVPVCQAIANWKEFDGQRIAILGRYSFREAGPQKGRSLDQEACGDGGVRGHIKLALDPRTGPKPPDPIAIDEPALEKKLAEIRQRTSLGNFRFGNADYDRWAVVIGRMERHNDAEYQLTYRGDGAVFFLADR